MLSSSSSSVTYARSHTFTGVPFLFLPHTRLQKQNQDLIWRDIFWQSSAQDSAPVNIQENMYLWTCGKAVLGFVVHVTFLLGDWLIHTNNKALYFLTSDGGSSGDGSLFVILPLEKKLNVFDLTRNQKERWKFGFLQHTYIAGLGIAEEKQALKNIFKKANKETYTHELF